MKKDYLIKLGMLQQEAERLGKENEAISKQVIELNELKINLTEFLNSKSKDSLISFGKGIYTKAELRDKELYVNIGSGIVVKKSVEDTIRVIDEQIIKLEEMKGNLLKEMENLNEKVQELGKEEREEQRNEG